MKDCRCLPEEQKEKIFSYNIPELFFIDIENKLQDGKPNPENPDKPITVIGICCPNDTIMVLSGGYNLTNKSRQIYRRIDEHFSQIKRTNLNLYSDILKLNMICYISS